MARKCDWAHITEEGKERKLKITSVHKYVEQGLNCVSFNTAEGWRLLQPQYHSFYEDYNGMLKLTKKVLEDNYYRLKEGVELVDGLPPVFSYDNWERDNTIMSIDIHD